MADKILINSGPTVEINTAVGAITLFGHNAITSVTAEQLAALQKRKDFNIWVENGYIILNAPLKNVNDVKQAQSNKVIAKQEKDKATIKLESLTNAIMNNEGIRDRKAAESEARKRLNMEADKAEQAGDSDANDIRRAAHSKGCYK